MKFDTFLLMLKENALWILYYFHYTLAVSVIFSLIQYFCTHTDLSFLNIIRPHSLLCLAALLCFSLLLSGTWFGVRIGGSELIFLLLGILLQLVLVTMLGFLISKSAGFGLKIPLLHFFLYSVILTIPLIILAIIMRLYMNTDMR